MSNLKLPHMKVKNAIIEDIYYYVVKILLKLWTCPKSPYTNKHRSVKFTFSIKVTLRKNRAESSLLFSRKRSKSRLLNKEFVSFTLYILH